MREKIYVEFLTYLNVIVETIENNRLMLVEVSGFSEKEQIGIPQLIPKVEEADHVFDGIFELDFKVSPDIVVKDKRTDWEMKVVFDLDKLPENIKCVRVNASKNADIAMMTEVS